MPKNSLILAPGEPREHRSLALFTAWSSLHAGTMTLQALQDTAERGHVIGDIPALAIVGIVRISLAPKGHGAIRRLIRTSSISLSAGKTDSTV